MVGIFPMFPASFGAENYPTVLSDAKNAEYGRSSMPQKKDASKHGTEGLVNPMSEWKKIHCLQDLPTKDGEYLVALHRITDFFGEPDEKEVTIAAYFYYEQKIWEITSQYSINALLPIFDVFDTFTTNYIDAWMPLPEPPKED
jgi:hypothetical protein